MNKKDISGLLSKYYIPYRPEFHRLTDKDGRSIGENAALFLSDIFHWSDKGDDPDGWIYKSQQDMEAETGLTRSKQEAARHKLMDLGILESDRRGERGVLHYRINMDILADLLGGYTNQIAENPQTEVQEIHNAENPECEKPAIQIADFLQSGLQKSSNLILHKEHTEKQQKDKDTAKAGKAVKPFDVYQQLLEIEPGMKKGQSLREIKLLLEGDRGANMPPYSPDDIVSCGRFLQTDPWRINNMVTLTTKAILEKISKWVSEGKPSTWADFKSRASPKAYTNGHGHKPQPKPVIGEF